MLCLWSLGIYTHPHDNRAVARSSAVLFVLGTPGNIMAYTLVSLAFTETANAVSCRM